jgi:hypothetical protein
MKNIPILVYSSLSAPYGITHTYHKIPKIDCYPVCPTYLSVSRKLISIPLARSRVVRICGGVYSTLVIHSINTALIPTTIRTEIARAFGRTVRIIDRAPEANDLVDAERRMKDRGQVSGTNDRKVAGSDYVLKGRMQSRDRQAGRLKSSFIVVTLEITDLVTSELVWTNDYQMKTESEKSVINR